MITDLKKVRADHDRLERAFENAIKWVQTAPTMEVSSMEKEEALDRLESSLRFLRKHEHLPDMDVISFFVNSGLDAEQMIQVLLALRRRKATKCHAFLSIPRKEMEREFTGEGKVSHIPYPTALRALHHAYTIGS